MEWSTEQVSWLVKVFQPERSVATLPGGWAGLEEGTRAALLGLSTDVYLAAHAGLVAGAKEAAHELLADTAVCAMVDRLSLKKNAKVVAFGDSHTSDPQSWAVILSELFAARRPDDAISVVISAVSGDTTTHGQIRIGEVIAQQPDWILFFIGGNDARIHGPNLGKTLIDHRETARNLVDIKRRVHQETNAQCLWITPPKVIEDRVARHWALARFGIHFRNEDIARVADAVRQLDAAHVDLFSGLGDLPPDIVTEDGLHFRLSGQKRITLEILRSWSGAVQDGGAAR
ncbi:SGNH/GDSL hydrolase family protein [Undibacterium sp. Di26W]|uniref:SGNH/GDSL hydrolase family protein n=1 Tax=Undibacterium sp. Di26W TaxID=3413035 RepID=UPI003BF45225